MSAGRAAKLAREAEVAARKQAEDRKRKRQEDAYTRSVDMRPESDALDDTSLTHLFDADIAGGQDVADGGRGAVGAGADEGRGRGRARRGAVGARGRDRGGARGAVGARGHDHGGARGAGGRGRGRGGAAEQEVIAEHEVGELADDEPLGE